MSQSGDVADQIVRETMMLTESAVKLTAMGAKNLAALVLALASDGLSSSGKSNLINMVKEGKEPAVFQLNQKDAQNFKKEAKQQGLNCSVIKSIDSDLVSVIADRDDTDKINRVFANLGYGTPSVTQGEAEKNVSPRAQSMSESTGRGSGLESKISATTRSENAVKYVQAPVTHTPTQQSIQKQTVIEQGDGPGIEGLSEQLLALIAEALMLNPNPLITIPMKSFVQDIDARKREVMAFTISSYDEKAFSKEARNQNIDIGTLPVNEGNNVVVLAETADFQRVVNALDRTGYSAMITQPEAPQREQAAVGKRSSPAKSKEKPPVMEGRIKAAKEIAAKRNNGTDKEEFRAALKDKQSPEKV